MKGTLCHQALLHTFTTVTCLILDRHHALMPTITPLETVTVTTTITITITVTNVAVDNFDHLHALDTWSVMNRSPGLVRLPLSFSPAYVT